MLLLQFLMIFSRARLKSNGLFSCGCAGFSASLLLQVDSTVKTFLSKNRLFLRRVAEAFQEVLWP